MSNSINPSHYKNNGYGMEAIDIIEAVHGREKTIIFCRLTAFQYRLRMGNKEDSPAEQDLAKEKWYLAKAKELERKGAPTPAPADAKAPKAPAKKCGRKVSFWTPERVEELRTMRDQSVAELAVHFGVTEAAIHNARSVFGVAKKHKAPKPARQKAAKPPKSQLDGDSYEWLPDKHKGEGALEGYML